MRKKGRKTKSKRTTTKMEAQQQTTVRDARKAIAQRRSKVGWETRKAREIAQIAPQAMDRFSELWREIKDTPASSTIKRFGPQIMHGLNFSEEVAEKANKELRKLVEYPPANGGLTKAKVSPPMAWAALLRSVKNRSVRTKHIDGLAKAMKAEKWIYNAQPIIFAANGELLTGQHRLLACLISGATFETALAFGIDPRAATTIDIGAGWSAGDAIARNLKNSAEVGGYYTLLGAALAWVERYNLGVSASATRTVDNIRIMELADQHRDMIRSVKVAMRIGTKFRGGITVPPLAFLHWLFHKKNAAQASAFFGRLEEGVGFNGKTDPVYVLRELLLGIANENRRPTSSIKSGQRRVNTVTVMAFFVKAWNAFRKNEPIERLRWSGYAEERPEPFPTVE